MSESPFIFDTGPLSHFAGQGWLGVLGALSSSRGAYIPDTVQRELLDSVDLHPHLRLVLDADWIEMTQVAEVAELAAFSAYSSRLVVGTKNLGECGVLAVAEVRSWAAVVDDRAARNIAKERGVSVTGTLALMCEGIREGLLTVPLVSRIADDLLSSSYRLPFQPGQFERWAGEQGMIDY